MRRYDIVSGILFVFSIIDFALAVPVLVQEKRQACDDVAHIPKNMKTVLGKRGDEEVAKLLDQYFKAIANQAESSDAHSSIPILESSDVYPHPPWVDAPAGPEDGSTSANVVQAHGGSESLEPPIPGSSDMHPSLSLAPPGLEHGSTSTNVVQAHGGSKPLEPPTPGSSDMRSSLSLAPPGLEHGSTSTNKVQAHGGSKPLEPSILGSTSTNVVQAHGGSKPLEPPTLGSSDMHLSLSLAPPGPERGSTSTNVVQAPAPYANSDWLFKPSGPSGASPMQGGPQDAALGHLNPVVMSVDEYLKMSNLPNLESSWKTVWPQRRPSKRPKTDPGLDPGLTSTNVVQAPAPNPASSTANPDRQFVPSGPSGAAPIQGSGEHDPLLNDDDDGVDTALRLGFGFGP